ncbi:hypothetical protein DMI65_17345 [Escherichia coli]|nr:hypothetical protein [Escherichia coli]
MFCACGTALRCKGEGKLAMNSISKNTGPLYHNVDERDETPRQRCDSPALINALYKAGLISAFCFR